MYSDILRNIILKCPKLKATQMPSVTEWIRKLGLSYTVDAWRRKDEQCAAACATDHVHKDHTEQIFESSGAFSARMCVIQGLGC